MYSLAQYVFGYGTKETKCPPTRTPIPQPELSTKAAKCSKLAANNSNECVQSTNIENDWILIDVAEESGAVASVSCSKKKASSSKGKQLVKPRMIKTAADPLADSRLSLDNIFGEHPCLSVFDNLFTYRPPAVEIRKVMTLEAKKKEVVAKPNPAVVATIAKVPAKLKKNATTTNNKKKAVTNGGQQQQLSQQIFSTFSLKATTASKDEALSNKKQQQSKTQSKKVTDRSNKVAMQRNGPIIRAKKMFTHFNGIYNNRNAC